MLTKQDIFNAWAPPSAIWSPWVKPVLFTQLHQSEELQPEESLSDFAWATDSSSETAIILNLPGSEGIATALKLTPYGYRPVPLYNACPPPDPATAIVKVRSIITALAEFAPQLASLTLPDDAPPIFLLDANRNPAIRPSEGEFDNRSISLPTDFPSANFLHAHGIRRVVLIQSASLEPPADLPHTLRRWQDGGLNILGWTMSDPESPKPIVVERPKAFRLLWYNVLATIGLKASPLGGFGGHLPMASSG